MKYAASSRRSRCSTSIASAHNFPIATLYPKRPSNVSDDNSHARLVRIVRLLSDNATIVISGTRIAEELGTSRSEVWRAVQQLREIGVQITGHPATGYQLESMPDLLLPDVLKPLLQGQTIGNRIHHYFRIGSTNSEAMRPRRRASPKARCFWPKNRPPGAGVADTLWESSLGWHLLLGDSAAAAGTG